jgi:hypothetical protein
MDLLGGGDPALNDRDWPAGQTLNHDPGEPLRI